MNVLIEGAIAGLLGNLLTELAGSVRRRLSGDPAHQALKAALSEALEAALQEAGLSPEEFDHFEGFFKDLFKEEAVLAELAQLLDPRPDRSLDLKKLAAELEEAGLDRETLPAFDLEAFLRTFAVAFYSAAGRQDALRGILDLKLLGQITVGVKTIAAWSERGALASERTADGVERLTGEFKELRYFLEGAISETALRSAVIALQAAGPVSAFDGWRSIEGVLLKSGYDIDIDKEGGLRIAGQPSEGKALPPAQLDTLRTVALDLRQAIAARSPSEAELDALAERYRQHIIRWFQSLTFHGMTPSARAIELPLEDVYVELRAVAEVPEAADSFSVEERRLLLEVEEKDPEVRRELLSQLDAFRRERWGRTLPERKSIAAALYQRDRHAFVILGDPGSGKSTLLHFLALVHARGQETAGKRLEIDPGEADRLPILVPLAAFDDMLRETPGLTLLDFLPRFYDRRRGLPGLGPLFRRALETGRALVLLDGLDEVLDTATRGYVAQQAGALIGEWSPRGVRFAISSRFVGYREAPVTGNLPTLSVLDFGEKEIEVFVHRWSHAYEKCSAGGVETPEMLRKARELERDLVEDVRSNESVRRLAANPLMITLLALLRRQVGRLPHRRVQLYEAYVSTMLYNWIEARSQGARERSIPALDRHQAENILIPLALWLQREKPSGTASGAELERQLTEICLGEKGISRENATVPQLREAQDHARRFLKEMRETTGLLIARGHDAFGFLHLTFQEYFAGRALALLDPEERWRLLRPHLHDPRWREPILLCAGRLGVVENRRKDVTDLVRRIFKHEDPSELHLYRNLLLALAIAHDVNLDRQLLDDLLDAAVQSFSSKVGAFRAQILGHLAQLAAEGETSALLDRCFAAVWRSEDRWFQRLAVRALGRFVENPEIRDALLSKLEDQNDSVRAAVVDCLGSVADKDLGARSVLLSKLKDQDRDVREAAVRSLAGLLAEDEEVRVAVFDCLADPLSSVAGEASKTLRPYAKAFRADLLSKVEDIEKLRSPQAVFDLISPLLADDEELLAKVVSLAGVAQIESRGARQAVRTLSSLVGEKPELLAIVIKAAKDPSLRSDVLMGLAPVLDRVGEARAFALACLRDETDYVRGSAVWVLSRLAGTDQVVRDAVFERLTDSSERVRRAAIQAMTPHSDLPKIRAALRNLVESGSWIDRREIAKAIGEGTISGDFSLLRSIRDNSTAPQASQFLAESLDAVAGLPGGREFLLACLRDDRELIRFSAAWALARMAPLDAVVHAALVERLGREGPEIWEAVAPLIEVDQEIRSKILDRIKDPNGNVRLAAAKSLSSSVGKDPKVDAAILERAKDDYGEVRRVAAKALVPLLKSDKEVRRTILNLLADSHPYVRSAAAQALSGLVEENQEIQREILHRLEVEDVHRGGFIIALSSVVGSNLEIRDRVLRELQGQDSSSAAASIVALGRVAAEDDAICSLILGQMTSSGGDRVSAIRALAPLAGTNAQIKAAIISRLEDPWFDARLEAVDALATLESAQPQQRGELWSRLEPWLAVDTDFSHLVEQARSVLAPIFGPRLPIDHNFRDRMVAQLQSRRWSARLGALLTLAAWPEGPPDEIVEQIFQSLSDQRGLESYPARLTAASFLINRNEDAEASIDLCLEALDYGTQPWEYLSNSREVRKQAALILGTLEPLEHNQRVYDRLLQVMKEDKDSAVRDAAYNALVRLAGVRDRRAAVA